MATYTDNAHFSAIENAGVYGGSVRPASLLDAASDYHIIVKLNPYAGANGEYAKWYGIASGGYVCYQSTDGGSSWSTVSSCGHGYRIYIDGVNALSQETVDTFLTVLGIASGTNRAGASVFSTSAASGACAKIEIYIGGYAGSSDIANVVLQLRTGSTPGGGDLLAETSGQTLANDGDTGWIAFYPENTAVALVHDSGALYCDAGLANAWDLSTAAETATGTATLKYQYAGYAAAQSWSTAAEVEAGATWNGTWLSLAELQAVGNLPYRYMYLKTQIDGDGADSLDAFGCDTYTPDVTPPAVPSSTKFSLFETDNYALIWVEPADSDFDHCELKRVVDGTTTYLGKNGSNLPEWQASPTTYWTFADDSTTADVPFSSYVDEDVAGTSIAYYVRSVDTSDNASAWTVFSEGSTTECSQPNAPTLVSATPGDGQVTLAVTLNAAGDPAYIVYGAGGARVAWSDPSADLKLTASGTIDVTGLSNLQEYIFDVVSESGDIYSLPSDVLHATPRASTQAATVAIRDAAAQAALVSTQHCGLGVQVQYRATPSAEAVDLWASLDAGRFVTQLRRQTETDTCDLTLTIPRQTGWPPAGGIENGSVLIYDSVEYEIDDHEWDRGDPALSASVTVHCGCWRHLGLF